MSSYMCIIHWRENSPLRFESFFEKSENRRYYGHQKIIIEDSEVM